ncbi:MAG: hypothetical protein WCO30_00920 [bacterium]
MNKKILLALLIGIVAIGGSVYWYLNSIGLFGRESFVVDGQVKEFEVKTPENGTYRIDSSGYKFKDGTFEREIAPGSASKEIIKFFGQPVMADLNGDGQKEAIVLLQKEAGGTGTFYYVAVSSPNEGGNYVSNSSEFIGDRIASQNIEYRDGQIIVNYADRKLSESFTVSPSIGVSRYYKYQNGMLVEDKTTYTSFACILNDGKWLPETSECEFGFNKAKCEELKGQFNECDSACRNVATSTKPVACTKQCVQVCKFN